ncbi:MAG: SGNH/GDSL hydrolase family protein [Mesorhizobium sp.]|uniref:SGNH/GDSL hydrolase family protein n=1 Tax=Mesorhizobium sp. TaxID=1871066 RepID=UPI000FE65901|nr:SGNH/GDSL hydrolase family protein [Mesorhizobium sp.]RWE04941.1 MAG: SGNH/GDSL hydrolase family protein [Mesorhizobium sp.]
MQRLLALLTWLAFPVYVWQGLGVRRRTTRMLPARGPVLHEIPGKAPSVALLVLGDSSAASVGIEQSERGRAVRWRAAGFNSATSGQIRDHVLPNLSADPWTHIVLAIGTNDTKNFHSVPRFKKEFGGLLYALRAKWPEARVVWSPVLEFTRAPAMPPLLGRILEIRATEMNRMGVRLCNERGAVPASRLPITNPDAGFASDGFHASEAGYRAWAEHLLDFVMGNCAEVR